MAGSAHWCYSGLDRGGYRADPEFVCLPLPDVRHLDCFLQPAELQHTSSRRGASSLGDSSDNLCPGAARLAHRSHANLAGGVGGNFREPNHALIGAYA